MVGEKLIMSSKSIDLKLLEVDNAQSQNLVEILLWVGKPPIDHHGWSPPYQKDTLLEIGRAIGGEVAIGRAIHACP